MTRIVRRQRLKQVHLLALLGPATSNRFESLAPEVGKLRGLRILGFHGTEESDPLCRGADPK